MADSREWNDSCSPFNTFVFCLTEVTEALKSPILKYAYVKKNILLFWFKVVLGSYKFFLHESFESKMDQQVSMLAGTLELV
jgi:hypothetical protein